MLGNEKGIITITTDFGLKDPYVAAMKGVMLDISAGATIVDITHLVSPGNIKEGALTISRAYGYFPAGTIHLGVVDPGVGGARSPLIIETEKYIFVGPDNGLFTHAVEKENIRKIIMITNRKYFPDSVSNTFHGRDIFAPVAAYLSLGVGVDEFGERTQSLNLFDVSEPFIEKSLLVGEIIYIDNFGNLITNIASKDVADFSGQQIEIEVSGRSVGGVLKTYGEVKEGSLLALIGSYGNLEIACNMGNAAKLLNAKEGDKVFVRGASE